MLLGGRSLRELTPAPRRLACWALTAAAIFVAGCGNDAPTADSSARYPVMVPRDAFVKRAKGVCENTKEELGAALTAFYEMRAHESGESNGLVGSVEAVPVVVVPSLKRELKELEAIGLPRGQAYEAEAVWQTLRTVVHEVEVEGIYAWRSAELLPPFRNRARQFGLQQCVVN